MANRTIENIVVIAELNQQLPLQTLSVSIPNTEFTEEDPVLIFRFEQPKRAVLITEQGTITSTGTTSLDEAKELIYNVIETLKKHAIPIQPLPEILIQNYVLSMQMDNKINLDLLLPKLQQNLTIFKPDRNPWIEYLYDENTTVLIHSSGKIICTGKGSLEQAHHALDMLSTMIE